MALTKTAFQQYIQERELSKELIEKAKSKSKYKHKRVFDDPEVTSGIETVHKRFTNGSQTVHKEGYIKTKPQPVNTLINNKNKKVESNNGSQTVHKRFTKPDTIIYNYNILNNIIINLKEEWKKIKVDLLSHIGFSEIHLLQLQDKNSNTPEIVQSSINHFAYGLKHNEKTKKYREDALNVFMGILRKGQAWIESNYKSSQELALEELVEQRKKERERYNRRVEELIDLEFSDWHNKLSEQEIEEIVPETFRVTRVPQDIVEYLKKYFRDKILIPRLKEQGISS